MPAFAVAMAMSAMTAQNVGAGKWTRVRSIARVGVLYNVVLSGSIALAMELLDQPLSSGLSALLAVLYYKFGGWRSAHMMPANAARP
jgi:Na+-driven multidrug efflux pump